MTARPKKILLLLLALLMLLGTTFMQRRLNHDRETLGLTRVTPLQNAPPLLAFTTVALGGFRGLIANFLWIRATELQDEDKFFEMAQLSDWITKLEPHFSAVWVFQAWNMSYNISVKFKDYPDRWRWVQRGIELLRDEGLKYNPNDVQLYRELAWHFQHKLGANLDDANVYYKNEWLKEMSEVFGKGEPQLDLLLHPQTPEEFQRLEILTNRFKMDPAFMVRVNETYGPLEWRLPEAHAIYWAALGLEKARQHPTKVKKEDLIQLRRVIYQSMQLSFQRGRLLADPFTKTFDTLPNLDIVQKVSDAYEQAMIDEPNMRSNIETAHRNLLINAAYFLYENDRIPEALKWYRYLGQKYPDKPLITGQPDSLPGKITLEEFALNRITEDVSETSRDRVRAAILGQTITSYRELILGNKQRYEGLRHLARILRATYMKKIGGSQGRIDAIGLPSDQEMEKEALQAVLDPEKALWPYEMRAALRAALNLPPEPPPADHPETPPAATTNAPAASQK
ncbi:MAG TPA: hypothetical protein PKN95_04010 [Verrucomicrobiota bacterium]|nr:hypothetical protein [Verrucomicrobiota bacterium]HNT13628.1 hypothetical protein [Verrucomicrobiota bacterium]